MCHGVAPLPLLADYSGGTGSRTAEASRSRLLALAAGRMTIANSATAKVFSIVSSSLGSETVKLL